MAAGVELEGLPPPPIKLEANVKSLILTIEAPNFMALLSNPSKFDRVIQFSRFETTTFDCTIPLRWTGKLRETPFGTLDGSTYHFEYSTAVFVFLVRANNTPAPELCAMAVVAVAAYIKSTRALKCQCCSFSSYFSDSISASTSRVLTLRLSLPLEL